MYAKLVANPDFNIATANNAGVRLKEISDVVTGVITSATKNTLVSFDSVSSTIVDSVAPGWTMFYTTPADFAMAVGAAGSVIWTSPTSKATRNKFFKLAHTATTSLMTGYMASSYTTEGVATNETNVAHSGWALSGLPVLYIKAVPGCLLFHAINNDSNAATSEPDIVGVIERTVYGYDTATTETPQVYVSINAVDGNSGCKVCGKYNPGLDSYTAIADLSVRLKTFATTGSSPGISRDATGAVAAPFVPLVIDDLASGWVGGNLSENSGFYRTANDLGRTNDLVVKDTKNYRVWTVGNYRYLVEEA